jgi:hypothetical protein
LLQGIELALIVINAALLIAVLLLVYAMLRVGLQIAASLVIMSNHMGSLSQFMMRAMAHEITAPAPAESPKVATKEEVLAFNGWSRDTTYQALWRHGTKPALYTTEEAFLTIEQD